MGLLGILGKVGHGIVSGVDSAAYNSLGGGLLGDALGGARQPQTGLLAPSQYDDEGNLIGPPAQPQASQPSKWQPSREQRANMRSQFLMNIGAALQQGRPLAEGVQNYQQGVVGQLQAQRAQQMAWQKQQAMASLFAPTQRGGGSPDDPGSPQPAGGSGDGGGGNASNSDINTKLARLAQLVSMGYMKPEEANAAREALEKTRPVERKIHSTDVRTDQNGQPVVVQTFTDGTETPSHFKPDQTFDDIDLGGAVARVDKRTGQVVSTLPKTMTPKELADLEKIGDPFQFFMKKHAEGLGKTTAQLTTAEANAALGKFREVNADPELRDSLLASRGLAEAQRQLALSQMPTQDQAASVANDIIHHRVAPDQMSQLFGRDTNGNFRRMVYTEAKKADPEFDFEQSAADYNLSKNPGFQQTVRYMDYAKDSMSELRNVAKKLGNGDFRAVNSVSNLLKGGVNNTDLKRFQTVRLDAADAVAKVLQGGGSGSGTSDAKLAAAGNIFRDSDSLSAIYAAADETEKLMGLRRGTLTKGTTLDRGQPQPAPQKAAPDPRSTYLAGHIYGGKTFLGGDPNNAGSWR